MPTRLDKGKVMLDEEYEVCREGKVLNSSQTALLKLFGVVTAEFRVSVLAYWSAATQEVIVVDGEGDGEFHTAIEGVNDDSNAAVEEIDVEEA